MRNNDKLLEQTKQYAIDYINKIFDKKAFPTNDDLLKLEEFAELNKVLPISNAAQWLVDTWNQNSALYMMHLMR